MQKNKILAQDELLSAIAKRRAKGEKVVFTNGCFDLFLHVGHVTYLQFARAQGDLLVVAINSDASVRALKGAPRPIVPQNERASMLAALECVDYVTIFDGPTPTDLISAVSPDILVKGEDWRQKGVVGREIVEARGGKVVLAPIVQGVSTTGIVERILRAYQGDSK